MYVYFFRNRPEFPKRTATINGDYTSGSFRCSCWLDPVRLAGLETSFVRLFVRSFVRGGWELCRCVAIGVTYVMIRVIDTECGLGSYG